MKSLCIKRFCERDGGCARWLSALVGGVGGIAPGRLECLRDPRSWGWAMTGLTTIEYRHGPRHEGASRTHTSPPFPRRHQPRVGGARGPGGLFRGRVRSGASCRRRRRCREVQRGSARRCAARGSGRSRRTRSSRRHRRWRRCRRPGCRPRGAGFGGSAAGFHGGVPQAARPASPVAPGFPALPPHADPPFPAHPRPPIRVCGARRHNHTYGRRPRAG